MRSRCSLSMVVSHGFFIFRPSGFEGVLVLISFCYSTLLYVGPGSFIEVRKILPLLTEQSPGQPSFHVVAYSLPGFGFSDGSKKRGFSISQHAEVCVHTQSACSHCLTGDFFIVGRT